MKFDTLGLILSETSPPPGCYGDSMAETARYVNIHTFLGYAVEIEHLKQFETETGYVRHPLSPWREDDMVTDQLMPYFIAARFGLKNRVYEHIDDAGFRTGNGDLVSPLFYAILTESPKLAAFALLAQWAIFRIPFRWSDSKKRFESNADSSADYLNWLQGLMWLHYKDLYLPKYVVYWTNGDKIVERIRHYYQDEPNSEYLVRRYVHVVEAIYAKTS